MLTMESKITVFSTTDPAELGYGTSTGKWKKVNGEVMSMKEALGSFARLSKELGKDVRFAISYQHDGKEIDVADIAEVVASDHKSKK